jgi:hypothetical protein
MTLLSPGCVHVKEAMEIALANYCNERQYIKDLPQVCDISSLYSFGLIEK